VDVAGAWALPPRSVQVALDGYDGPTNVGILMAEKLGYFADVDIGASVTTPVVPESSLRYVSEATVDLGVSHQPEVVLQRKGAPLIAVGSLISRPTAALIWLGKSKIRRLADLKGKTVAIPGIPFQRKFLGAVLARVGLTLEDVEVKQVGYKLVPALVSGRADAIFGGSWNLEGATLEARGLRPVVTRVKNLGVPAYDELVVVARSAFVAKKPDLVHDFMAAVARGTAAAVADPEGAVQVIEESIEKDSNSGRGATEAKLAATLPLLSGSGYMDPVRADRLVDWMYDHHLIHRRMPASELLTNRYLER
jgi:ABC-type nitrate/sulfonate/bicarbonate transport system substrate-binding protein